MATLSQLTEDLEAYRAARTAVLTAQEYTIGSRRLRRVDLAIIEREIARLEARIALIKNQGKINTGHVIFGGHRG